ncbi:GNAT family N-acetyltransferase [Microbacterium sp.]|uniref:GNAT family N-acetyltransferase n=1 Tax=Microbacterium sp. TaxID=51671 RepID=UPI0028127333|nr:GNAT family N-acetyltransferase [Microbacterium sp.]
MSIKEPNLNVITLDRTATHRAAVLLGRGMADNPVHVAVYRGGDEHRARCHARLTRTLLTTSALDIEGVEQAGELIGVAASAAPGRCQPYPPARLRLLATASTLGVPILSRLLEWNRTWARHDPTEPHVHLGPVSVDRHLRGRGIGSLLLLRHVARLDAIGAVGYLETDRPEAVGFYNRFDYAVIGEADVLGVPTWFMRRPAG